MTFIKNFVNVLSVASISFILLTAIFAFIVYFNLLNGKIKSKAGIGFVVFGVILAIAGLWITPLLYLAVAYFLVMWGCAMLGGKLWDTKVGVRLLIGGTVAFALSILDSNFMLIAGKPDNVPIVGMIFLLGIFTWIALRKAYHNDQQILSGGIPYEKTESDEKLFTWPDLVYTEMLCMIVLSIVMIVWSVGLRAPLEEAANPTSSPNPAKAPWYFLGLQEMLVYFDPWLAGVVLPTLIIVGLMAIPYIDTNPKGNGYYSFRERKWEIGVFLYGFLVLWSFLIITGTFLRGPNWSFYRALRVLGSKQARTSGERRLIGADLGQAPGDAIAEALGDPRSSRACTRRPLPRPRSSAGLRSAPPLLSEDGRRRVTTSASSSS